MVSFVCAWGLTAPFSVYYALVFSQTNSLMCLRVCKRACTWAGRASVSITALYSSLRLYVRTVGCIRFHPMVQCVEHVREGLACRACATPACLPASHCKQGSVAIPSCAQRGHKKHYFLMGPKPRYLVLLTCLCLCMFTGGRRACLRRRGGTGLVQ